MMQKILVEVGYYYFYFDCMAEAVAFAGTAKQKISDEESTITVKLTVKFIKEESAEK